MAWKAMQKSWFTRHLSIAYIQVMHLFEGVSIHMFQLNTWTISEGREQDYIHFALSRVSSSAPDSCNDFALVKLSQTQWDILHMLLVLDFSPSNICWKGSSGGQSKPGEFWNAVTKLPYTGDWVLLLTNLLGFRGLRELSHFKNITLSLKLYFLLSSAWSVGRISLECWDCSSCSKICCLMAWLLLPEIITRVTDCWVASFCWQMSSASSLFWSK